MLHFFYSTRIRILADTGISLFILRVLAAGYMFFGHGFSKVISIYIGLSGFADPIGISPELSLILSAIAESICALFVIFGFLTRFSALVLMINMSVAIFFLYNNPASGNIELTFLYLLLFTSVFILGPGKHSVDYYFPKNGLSR